MDKKNDYIASARVPSIHYKLGLCMQFMQGRDWGQGCNLQFTFLRLSLRSTNHKPDPNLVLKPDPTTLTRNFYD